jgi:hypothetical protein
MQLRTLPNITPILKVGGVSGEKRIVSAIGVGAVAEEGLYWKYESFLKKLDSDLHTVVGAAGELFSVRKSLYEAVGNNIILDDFYISLGVCERGYLVKYEPTAYGEELPSQNVKEEEKRKIRIAAGGFQAMQIFVFTYESIAFWNAQFSICFSQGFCVGHCVLFCCRLYC